MRSFSKFVVFISILFVNNISFGQEMKITGVVHDSTGIRPVLNAVVMAVRIKDSLLLGFTRTDNEGKFELKGFEIDTFSLIIDHPHFDEKTYYMFGHAENYEINIPGINMPFKSQEIEEVVIYANKNPIFYRGDTLVYVADSFKVHEGAVVEDLLKKLPGIQVDKDGKITMAGEEISQVLVDGDEFFGTDPTIATKNLGADGIQEVQVYEKENDDGIGGDDEKIQVLDLRLKDDAKNGYFGRISGASDFATTPLALGDKYDFNKSFYEGEMLLNMFQGSRKVSVFALSTNTPRSNFARGDMSKFGLQEEDGANSNWWDDNTRTTSGIPRTLRAGVYYSDKIGKKKQTKIGMNYSYYNTVLKSSSSSRSQYFLTDTTYLSDDSTYNETVNQSHRINFNLETKLDSLTTLTIKPSFRYDMASTETSDATKYMDQFLNETLGTSVTTNNDSKGYKLNGKVVLNRRFKKKKRELELRYDMVMSDNETDGYLGSETRYISGILPDSITDQQKINDNTSSSHYGTFTYIEPLGKNFKLETEYLYEYGFSTQDKESFDDSNNDGTYNLLRTDLSNIFENTRQQHRVGLSLIYELKNHSVTGGIRVRNIDINNQNITTGLPIEQNFTNVLPKFRYRYSAGRGKHFVVEYNTSSQQPSINDLQPVPDNSNPNRINQGNANLVPNYSHNFSTNFRNFDIMSGSFTFAGGNFTLTNNAFTDSTAYDAFGRTNSKTVNVDGNMFGVVYGGVYIPVFKQKMTIQPMLTGSFFNNKNFISGMENQTTNYSIAPQLELGFKFLNDSLEFDLDGKYTYNSAYSSLSDKSTPSSVESYGAGVMWILPGGFRIEIDGTYNKNSQSGRGYDTEFFILNAELAKRLLKTQNLEISLMGNDIFNQNVTANREVNGNIITDYRTTVISRYFLLKATYRFNNRKTREDDFKGMH